MRQLAGAWLLRQGATDVIAERHARWVGVLVAESSSQYHGPNETAALERIEREHANVQVALDGLLDQGLWWFRAAHDHWTEATGRLTRLIDRLTAGAGQTAELDLLWMAGSIALDFG